MYFFINKVFKTTPVASFHSSHLPGVLCPSFSTAMGWEQGKAGDVASTVAEGREPPPHAQIPRFWDSDADPCRSPNSPSCKSPKGECEGPA